MWVTSFNGAIARSTSLGESRSTLIGRTPDISSSLRRDNPKNLCFWERTEVFCDDAADDALGTGYKHRPFGFRHARVFLIQYPSMQASSPEDVAALTTDRHAIVSDSCNINRCCWRRKRLDQRDHWTAVVGGTIRRRRFGGRARRLSLRWARDPELLHLVGERRPLEAQASCRSLSTSDDPIAFAECSDDLLSLGLLQRVATATRAVV
jgi:hypothetical protein